MQQELQANERNEANNEANIKLIKMKYETENEK